MKQLILQILLLSAGLCADLNAAPTVEQQLDKFLNGTASLAADFRQERIDPQGKATQTSGGKFYLQRPGRFRWQYQQPYEQEIVSDGQKIWFYDADLEQVTIKPVNDALGTTPAMLLSGQTDVNASFYLQTIGQTAGTDWIKLIPKNEENGFKYILIGFADEQLRGMELSDNFGQLTRISFTNLQQNIHLSAEHFEFTIPEGIDVFSQD